MFYYSRSAPSNAPIQVSISSGERVDYNGLIDCSFIPTDFGKGIFRLTKTRFDSIAFCGKGRIEKLSGVLKELDNACQMYTFQYDPEGEGKHEGVFYLTVHSKGDKGIGAGMPLYCGHVSTPNTLPEYEKIMEQMANYLHRNGDFDWGKYFS